MDSVKDSISQALKERFTNPLWGYIILSWVGFNWQNLAWLFMSKQDVEKRIEMITSQSWFYCHYLILPILVGASLAALSPYFKLGLSIIHKKAESKLCTVERDRSINNLQIEIDIMEKTAERNFTSRHAEANEQKRLIEIEEEQKQLPLKTEAMQKEYTDIINQIKIFDKEINTKKETKDMLEKDIEELKGKVNKVSDIFNKYNSPSNHESIRNFLEEISTIFKDVENNYPSLTNSTSIDDAKTALDNINKASLAGLAPYNLFGGSQYKTALEQIQKSLAPHQDFAKLAASASLAFTNPNLKQIHDLSRQVGFLKDQYPQISSLSSQTSEALKSLTSENINNLSKYAELARPENVDIQAFIRKQPTSNDESIDKIDNN